MNEKNFRLFNKLFLLMMLLSLLVITGCKRGEDPSPNPQPDDPVKIVNTVDTWQIMEGTEFETTVYHFKSNVPGPKIAITGGIHGDEVAGWKCALELVARRDFYKGEVLIIPQANILADDLIERYPGIHNHGVHNGIKYQNLNRVFPGNPNGNNADGTLTEKLCYEIVQTIETFAPAAMIDLHESVRGWNHPTEPRLGSSVIYGNIASSLFCEEMVDRFNANYVLPGEATFQCDNAPVKGGHCWYFGNNYEDCIVFTIETDRRKTDNGHGEDTQLERRTEQQVQLMDIFFDLMWSGEFI